MKRVCAFPALLLGVALAASAPSIAGAAGPFLQTAQTQHGDPVRAELVAEHRGIVAGEPFWIAVRLEMEDGWDVNWINPGDAGLAPEIRWTLPPGFSAEEIRWPYPRRFDISGLSIFGYGGEVLLMCRLTPPQGLSIGESIRIGADVTWLACRESCVPGEAGLTLALPVFAQPAAGDFASRWKAEFDLARAEAPIALEGWRVEATLSGDFFVIEAAPVDGEIPALEGVAFFPFHQGVIEHSAPQTWKRTGALYRLEVRRDRMSQDKPDRLSGVLVSPNGWGNGRSKAVAIDVPID